MVFVFRPAFEIDDYFMSYIHTYIMSLLLSNHLIPCHNNQLNPDLLNSYESCNQLKTKGSRLGEVYKDGYYNIKGTGGNMRTVYCDMNSDAGAWTLLVTSATGGWTKPQVRAWHLILLPVPFL